MPRRRDAIRRFVVVCDLEPAALVERYRAVLRKDGPSEAAVDGHHVSEPAPRTRWSNGDGARGASKLAHVRSVEHAQQHADDANVPCADIRTLLDPAQAEV